MIGHEERVEPAPLQRLDAAFQMRKIEIHVRPGAGIAPGAGVDARRAHESAKAKLTFGTHVIARLNTWRVPAYAGTGSRRGRSKGRSHRRACVRSRDRSPRAARCRSGAGRGTSRSEIGR